LESQTAPFSLAATRVLEKKQKGGKIGMMSFYWFVPTTCMEGYVSQGCFFTSRRKTRNTEYSQLMEEITDLREENKELLEFINRDKKRLKQRKHWNY
jgi:hypothetical protein